MPVHLAPDLKFMLQDVKLPQAPLRLMVAVKPEVGAQATPQLEALGCTVRGRVGDVLTLECDLATLARLAQSPLLLSIELGGPLYPEAQA